jgi:hypothetical protein
MKLLVSLALFVCAQASAQDLYLDDYHYTVTDVARRGYSKEDMFQNLQRKLLKIGDSICSNRALIWGHDMKRRYGADTAKIFLFYSEKTGEVGDKTWWYHVAPMVGDRGKLWVVDAGFPRFVKRPLTKEEWLKKFAGSTNCKPLEREDEDLVRNMFKMVRFPSTTPSGTYDCYYRIAPAAYWTPATVAMNMLGENARGEPVNFSREAIVPGEVLSSCIEAIRPGGWFSGSKRKRCRTYLGI